ncbi:SET domain-containing protein [Paraburkholderia phymatum]|uniref:SET domain-containing protein n=1 Tax=Paraburkholderia phymatum TaxID=148447 RepID=A0ACC6U8E1_9BURK
MHGQGVFANQNIGRAELISEYKGTRVSWQDVVQGASRYGKTPGHTFLLDTGDGTVIDGARGGSTVRWMNHSCEPNCKAYVSDGRVFIYTLRDVKRGEELTIDYGLVVEGPRTDEVRDLIGATAARPTAAAPCSLPNGFKPPEVRVLKRPPRQR